MLTDVLPYLRCPVCDGPLLAAGPSVRCPGGHAFDVARAGYVHLAPGRVRHPGDSAAMVDARGRWLDGGGYDFLSAALAAAAAPTAGLIVDAGAGTAHHLAAVLAACPDAVGLAVDVSKAAVRRAARAHPRAGAVLADTWRRLPVADGAAEVVLSVCAPRHGAEFARVLGGAGTLLVVTPTRQHLAELSAVPGLLQVPADKDEQVAASLAPWFRPADEQVHRRAMRLRRDQARLLVEMGPSARHVDPCELAPAVAMLPEPVTVTAAFRLARFHPAPLPSI